MEPLLPAISADPLTEHCREPWQAGEHTCLGISPFNSYFSTERVAALLDWAQARFTRLHLFVPDRAAAYTLEALGYPPSRARRKAHRQARYLHNKIDRAREMTGLAEQDAAVLDADALASNARYTNLREHAQQQFDHDPTFRDVCLQASHWVLQGHLAGEPTDEQQHAAVRYFLAELPLFLDTPGIVGARSSVFGYHQPPAVLSQLYRRELPCWLHPRQGFVRLTSTVQPNTIGSDTTATGADPS